MTTDLRKLASDATEWTARGELAKAVEAWREVVRLDPPDLGAQQKLAEVLHRTGEDAQAVEIYRALADVYAQGGEPIKAIALGKAIREIDTENREAQRALATLYARPTQEGGDGELEIEIDEQPPTRVDPLAGVAKEPETAFESILSAASQGRAAGGAAAEGAAPAVPVPSPPVPAAAIPAPVRSLPYLPLFSDLSPDAFVALTESVERRYVRKGETILSQGEAGDSFFVLVWGQARVERRDETGQTTVLAHLGEGAFFGEMALLSGAPRAATVIAEEDTELLEIRAAVLHRLCLDHPQVAEALTRFYRQRLLANLLAVSPLFRPFGAQECRDIMERFYARPMRAGERIIQEGSPSDGLYVVLSGSVDVRKRKGGTEVLAGHLAEGDVFGEMSCLSGGPATATIVGHRSGILLRLPRQAFDALVSAHPQVRELFSQLSDERGLSLEAILSGHAEFTEEGLVLI
jgi:CRP-like cAMP-binding protein